MYHAWDAGARRHQRIDTKDDDDQDDGDANDDDDANDGEWAPGPRVAVRPVLRPGGRRGEPGVAVRPADPAHGVYGISVAAELAGMGAQTLRLYEARGLLEPDRTPGGTRRYSPDDLDRLRRISDLTEAGLNLAGIAMVLDLQDQNTQLREGPTGEHQGGGTVMSRTPRIDPHPLDGVEDADRLDQLTPQDPATTDEAPDDDPPTPSVDGVDEADLLDQHITIPVTEEDYPPQDTR